MATGTDLGDTHLGRWLGIGNRPCLGSGLRDDRGHVGGGRQIASGPYRREVASPYDKALLPLDLAAGLTVWALMVAEAMAYAGFAGAPVQFGL